MSALLRQVALVSESDRVTLDQLTGVSAALQKQAARDLAPIWDLSATVDAFAKLEEVPLGYWPMVIKDDIGVDGAAGIHMDKDHQPFALITSSENKDVWSLTASHELLEMLVDPFGNRLVAGDSPKPDQGRVMFLVEVCDPSEDAAFAYTVNGERVSDFYTPHFFDPVAANGVRYSYTDAIAEPRKVLRGGYLSWMDPTTNHWWQEYWFSGNQSSFRDLGPLSADQGSLRSQIDRLTNKETNIAVNKDRLITTAAGLTCKINRQSTTARADSWRKQFESIIARSTPSTAAAESTRRSAGRTRRDK